MGSLWLGAQANNKKRLSVGMSVNLSLSLAEGKNVGAGLVRSSKGYPGVGAVCASCMISD